MFEILLYSYSKHISLYLVKNFEYNRRYRDKKLNNNYFEAKNVVLIRDTIKHVKNSGY